MKKPLVSVLLCTTLCASAQLLDVGSVTQVDIPKSLTNKVAAISPDGSYLLITTDYNAGLTRYDLATGKTREITQAAGAGYDVKISRDGGTVIYRENSYNDHHMKMTAVKSRDLATGREQQLVAPTRKLQAVDVQEMTSTTVVNGKSSVKGIAGTRASKSQPILSVYKLHLVLTIEGVTSEFTPLGTDKHYIWPSVSPDGTKALFYVGGVGAYVCNLDGSDLKPLGEVRAPRWYSNDVIVGMNDQDDGRVYTSSSIIAVDLNGTSQTLTDDSVIAMYPLPTEAGDKIAFSTPTGEAYIININK